MQKKENNYAYIDSQNLHLSIRELGWKLDYRKFRTYLAEKYGVSKAYLFIGYIAGNTPLYTTLQNAGYICIFRPTLQYVDGTTKGNCDAELVLQAVLDLEQYDRAVIVTGDGDFYCLVSYLIEHDKLRVLLVPNRLKYSALLKMRDFRPFTRSMNDLEQKLRYEKKKRPHKDGTL